MNLNNLGVGKMLVAKVLHQTLKHGKQWSKDQVDNSQKPNKNPNRNNNER